MEILTPVWNILKVALGLGFVIFLHELGHFLLAKWNGVKVEKFSIGFGPTLVGFRRGETEYVLAAIPLGGFVKMLGESPDEEANKSTDPRAYPNKSVGARMAIISAGVIMNVLLGLACFVYAYGQGMEEVPAMIGVVKPDSPAYKAGIRPGDEIVAIDGRRDINFGSMMLKVSLSGAGQKVNFEIARPGQKETIPITIEPRREESDDVPRIGVAQETSLTLGKPPVGKPVGYSPPLKPADLGLKLGDTLIALGTEGTEPEKIDNAEAVKAKLAADRSVPLVQVFERSTQATQEKKAKREEIKVVAQPNHVVDFGFRLTPEPISSIQANSPASKAGFQVGDLIVKVDGSSDFDPMRLPEICFDRAGQTMTFVVERPGSTNGSKEVAIEVVPERTPYGLEFFPSAPLDIPGLGLAYPIRPKISAIDEGSPAAKAGLHVGDVLGKFALNAIDQSKESRLEPIAFSAKNLEWPYAFSLLQGVPARDVELTINGSSKPVRLQPRLNPDWYNPWRGLQFRTTIRTLPPQGVQASLRRGFDDTVDNILRIYAMLRSLAQKRVSPKLLGGPIMIASVAYSQADTGLTELVHFLGILSINLAVLNFLPVPPLDGGQMVFLIAEKVRGRPLPDSAMIVGSWIGIGLLLFLMVYVMYQDILRFFFH
ncbi:RIP metalloprotease RseP [Singulisphaera acidiphila]|uniref:RIP metalloprotease RseP n=1 Tax=Singulisphaera acidiphila (strain ATCC BAA-1392 / DSM 18658 / VKM B-2454 / MOB10) TaxID=886293 RepID=L0DB81_SINAD|nr:RIP metalloprotease RseP [Singulisphaera acidiphila]AGA26644.1 RIP metalloprotease RseP [Singulisphaera acidiphila DSM 18658]